MQGKRKCKFDFSELIKSLPEEKLSKNRFVEDAPMKFRYKGRIVSAEEYLKLKEADEQEGKGNEK